MSGNCYLGIDAGSTTTKVALVAEDGTLLYSFYSSNNGSPLATAIIAIKEIYEQLPKDAHIAIFLLHRLRRSAGKSCPDAGRRRSGDSRPLLPLQLSSIRKLTVSLTSAVRI